MSTEVDAREAWADEFLTKLDTYAGALNQAGSLQFAAKRELTAFARTQPEGYVLVSVKPVARMLYWLGKKLEAFPHNRIVRTFAEFPKPKEPSKYWREGEPLYMAVPEAIDTAAQEGK